MILVAGHFGTLYSYATVAGRVAEALRAAGLLAGCQNIDEAWHVRWNHLRGPIKDATHVFLVSAPNHYISGYSQMFGKERSAIFVSPNTDKLADEHAETIDLFGNAIAPSHFCADTVGRQCSIETIVIPLGSPVNEDAAHIEQMTNERIERIAGEKGEFLNVLHFTSDQAWPSRKGTETLIKAWSMFGPDQNTARLTIHGPASLRKSALYAIADAGIDETVDYLASPSHGTPDEDLLKLILNADLIVAPSRSEGFGMMMLAALVARVPLLTTFNTGHAEFLRKCPGEWLGIPTADVGPLAYETGNAPIVEAEPLADLLDLSMMRRVLFRMTGDGHRQEEASCAGWGSWEFITQLWVERLKEWMEETA